MRAEPSALQPSHECDLVLKGGVTSGIVYPAAIARIAKDYRFRAVGGTSAGAIGAAAAAAMEFGRRSARNPGAPAMLAALSEELAEDHDGSPLLQRLFEPEPDNEPLFTLLMELAAIKRTRGVAAAALHILLPPLGMAILVAFILVAGLFVLSAHPTGIATGIALVLLFLFTTLVMLVAFLIFDWAPVVSNGLKAAGTHGFGFCSGKAQHCTASGKSLPSLSGWLHDKFQTLAGLDDGSPLCFGDLWIAEHRTAGRDRAEAMIAAGANKDRMETMDPVLDLLQRDIELALVASDITRAQSVQLPFMRREDRLYARISDLKGLFPDIVVDWMIAHARRSDLEGVTLGDIDPADLIRLPASENLPILFAVRMSLSFPFLFRAVRLYIIRHRPGGTQALSELWLADGGITSNFPIHLFDAPIPTRPTFCLNLLYHDDELEPDERGANPTSTGTEPQSDGLTMDAEAPPEELVYMLRSNRGRVSAYTPLPANGMGALLKFAGRIVTTARQWGDNQLIDVPGYRDPHRPYQNAQERRGLQLRHGRFDHRRSADPRREGRRGDRRAFPSRDTSRSAPPEGEARTQLGQPPNGALPFLPGRAGGYRIALHHRLDNRSGARRKPDGQCGSYCAEHRGDDRHSRKDDGETRSADRLSVQQ